MAGDWIRESFRDLLNPQSKSFDDFLNPQSKSENVSDNVPQTVEHSHRTGGFKALVREPADRTEIANLEELVGTLSFTHNLRKRPHERKLPTFAAPDNFDFEFGTLDESGNHLVLGDDLRKQGLFRLVMELRKQVPPPSSYGNINRLLEPDEWGEFTEDNLMLALAEQIAITKLEFSMHNVRRGANLLKLLREVQMSSKLIASVGASATASVAASSVSS